MMAICYSNVYNELVRIIISRSIVFLRTYISAESGHLVGLYSHVLEAVISYRIQHL